MVDNPINQYKQQRLRESIGYVPQDHFLFSTNIAENIAFTNPKIATEKIHDAARLAHIHEDILGFTEGYGTIVGERGRIVIWRSKTTGFHCPCIDHGTGTIDFG